VAKKKEINLQEYLKAPDECPYCHSSDISAEEADFSDNIAFRYIECDDCGKHWQEEFTITGVYLDE
jgi:hypothetical protein